MVSYAVVKSRPYGSWTRQNDEKTPRQGGRGSSRASGRETPRARDRAGGRGRSRGGSGVRYDRLVLVAAGVVLILVAVGMVFADVREAGKAAPSAAAGPKDRNMTLTVPSMNRVEEVPVYGDSVEDETALHNGTLHVKDTGFPWQEEANVYIAGHRLGYPRTDSFLVFWDLHLLKNGQRVFLTDSENTRYVYRVFDRRVVGPNEVSVKKPIRGKNIVTLQTCTLPDYSQRLIVQAELTDTSEKAA